MYGYKCDACGHELEKLQKLSDAPLTDCPECNKPELKKTLASGTGICLMGHGWYKPGMSVSGRK